jgi:hypothetical protein
MPADITGTEIIEEDRTTGGERSSSSVVRCSPISSLRMKSIEHLPRRIRIAEAMQEGNVTIQGVTYELKTLLRSGHAESDRDGRNLSSS